MIEHKPDPFITDGKGFYTLFESPLVTGYMAVPIPKGDPVLRWHGPKINLEKSWWPALAFMETHQAHEVVLRLFMLPDKSEIIIFPLSQIYGTGLSVKEEISTQEREDWAKAGLIEAGTMHSHCDGSAFASSTDKADEQARDGLHLTIGKLKSDRFDLHARMTWTIPGEELAGKVVRASIRTTQPPNLIDWFMFPDYVTAFIAAEPELEQDVIKYILTKPPHAGIVSPAEWKEKLIQRAAAPPWKGPEVNPIESFERYYQQQPLSMADDIPKKKENSQNDQSHRSGITQKESHIWDLWSEVMGIISDYAALRERQVSVSDFDPVKRPHLFKAVPQALEAWNAIRKMLVANNVTEHEFFHTFDDRIS